MHYRTLLTLAALCTSASACGLGPGESETGFTTEPVPVDCAHEGEIYEDGEEFESADGCVSYQCDDGIARLLHDDRTAHAGDLELATQQQVDALSCLGVVTGSLLVSDKVTSLAPLGSLYRVDGDLNVASSEVETLAGLEGLGEVGGSVVIADNPRLVRLSFQTNMSVFGDVTIQNNDALPSLQGAEFIGQCTTCTPPPSGAGAGYPGDDGSGLDAEPASDGGDQAYLGTFYGKILVADNDALNDVYAMSNLYYAWDDVRFRNNASLTSLSGLMLAEVQGDLEISDHPAMPATDAEAFAARVEVWGAVTLCGNQGGGACP